LRGWSHGQSKEVFPGGSGTGGLVCRKENVEIGTITSTTNASIDQKSLPKPSPSARRLSRQSTQATARCCSSRGASLPVLCRQVLNWIRCGHFRKVLKGTCCHWPQDVVRPVSAIRLRRTIFPRADSSCLQPGALHGGLLRQPGRADSASRQGLIQPVAVTSPVCRLVPKRFDQHHACCHADRSE